MITHDYQLIFIHVPKCAGRSVADIFNQRFDHFTARYYEEEYCLHWKDYHKFTIVRHPLARLVSIYTYAKAHRRHSNEGICCLNYGRDGNAIPDFNKWLKINLQAYNQNKMHCAAKLLNSPEGMRGFDGQIGSPFWFTSQLSRVASADGTVEPTIFKLEDGMHAVERYIERVIGQPVQIQKENVSNDTDDWRYFYDATTLQMALKWKPIKDDMLAFNYNPQLF